MHIRKMSLDDVEAVYKLSAECFSEPWSLEAISQELDNAVASYFVAQQEEDIVGYVGLWHVLDEGEVINIAVSHSVRRQGIGEKLLQQLMQEAKLYDLKTIHLEVRESNKAARALYEKYGFKPIAIRKRYYHKPKEDAVIMEWNL